jgi:2-polyprenyl-3-methyl-5-hydroxy-6-metoxy-1,4-benzoquinol methylase
MSPPSNAYLQAHQLNTMERFYPLHAYVCEQCFLVQLEAFETPGDIFSDYAYFSSYSESWLVHAADYASMITDRLSLDSTSHVVEIASNDGYLLKNFVARGIDVTGVEPAANVAEVAAAAGIPTRVEFFGQITAAKMTAEGRQANLLIGNNVLAHVPDINDFCAGLKQVLAPLGVITMEFPSLAELMRSNQFDTIYHEHFSYLSLTTVEHIFSRHGLTVFDVDHLSTHGGSLRIYASHADDPHRSITDNVTATRARERQSGMDTLAPYQAFGEQVRTTKRRLLRFLLDAADAGKTVVGYGAPAKGNTLLNYCGVRSDLIDYTVDLSPHKQGRFLPGTHIRVHAPEMIAQTKPDYVLILPWNLRDEIITQMAGIRAWGGQFVVFIPDVEVIP